MSFIDAHAVGAGHDVVGAIVLMGGRLSIEVCRIALFGGVNGLS